MQINSIRTKTGVSYEVGIGNRRGEWGTYQAFTFG